MRTCLGRPCVGLAPSGSAGNDRSIGHDRHRILEDLPGALLPAKPTSASATPDGRIVNGALTAVVAIEQTATGQVYLPLGARWTDARTGEEHEGGEVLSVGAPLERIPVFLRDAAEVPIRE